MGRSVVPVALELWACGSLMKKFMASDAFRLGEHPGIYFVEVAALVENLPTDPAKGCQLTSWA